jgi:hypothetical protein
LPDPTSRHVSGCASSPSLVFHFSARRTSGLVSNSLCPMFRQIVSLF